MTSAYKYDAFLVTFPSEYIAHVEINRPEKLNAFKESMWLELEKLFKRLSSDPEVRCVILSGKGEKAFTTGLDVEAASQSGALGGGSATDDVARRAFANREHILEFQRCISSIERCQKPVIVVLHGYAYGLAIDIACSADIRICSHDVKFSVKEVDIGLAADIGTLTRLPKSGVSLSWAKDICYSARIFAATEALNFGFVSEVAESKADAIEKALLKAKTIAEKSPVAVQGTKNIIDYSRDHTIDDGLVYTAVWNAAMLQTEDLKRAMMSGLRKQKATFSKL